MKKNKIISVLTIAAVVILGNTMSVSAASGEGKNYVSEFPETVVREATDTYVMMNSQYGIPVVSDWWAHKDDSSYYTLYCSDINNLTVQYGTLTKGEKLKYGIAYLLKNSYPNKQLLSNIIGHNTGGDDTSISTHMANFFITQYALWTYQGSSNIKDNLGTVELKFHNPSNTVTYGLYKSPFSEDNFVTEKILWADAKIDELLTATNAANEKDPEKATLIINASDEWQKSDEGYTTNLISLEPSSDQAKINSYSLSLENANEGIKVFKEGGEEITGNLSNLPAGTKIYIFVPKEIAKKGPKFKLNATASITYDVAYQYVDVTNLSQPSVLIGPESKEIVGAKDLSVIDDTASSVSGSLYLVGFLILLSGAGIIYANVKPRKQTNE